MVHSDLTNYELRHRHRPNLMQAHTTTTAMTETTTNVKRDDDKNVTSHGSGGGRCTRDSLDDVTPLRGGQT